MDRHFLFRDDGEDNDKEQCEGDQSPMLEKGSSNHGQISRRSHWTLFPSPWLFSSLVLNFSLVIFLLVKTMPHETTSPIFKGPTITTHFEPRRQYMSLDHEYDIYWEELLINNSHWPALAFGADHDKWLGRATITMIHQIHCLQNLREALQGAREGKDIGVDWRDNKHWPHCFDTLLQSIVCYADGTLERPDIVDGVVGHAISGYKVERQCRDASPVYRLFEEKGIIWPPEGQETGGNH